MQEFRLQTRRTIAPALSASGDEQPEITPLAELEKHAILTTIRQLHGDKLTAARMLGIGKTTLYRKLKEYGIGDSAFHDNELQ